VGTWEGFFPKGVSTTILNYATGEMEKQISEATHAKLKASCYVMSQAKRNVRPRTRAYRSRSRVVIISHDDGDGGEESDEEQAPELPARQYYFSGINPFKKKPHSFPLAKATSRLLLHGFGEGAAA